MTLKQLTHTHKKTLKIFLFLLQYSMCSLSFFFLTLLYWFCHTSTCTCHRCTRVPHPEPLSHLPPRTIPEINSTPWLLDESPAVDKLQSRRQNQYGAYYQPVWVRQGHLDNELILGLQVAVKEMSGWYLYFNHSPPHTQNMGFCFKKSECY